LFDPGHLGRDIAVGIGDDAAVLVSQAGSLVWSIDAAVEGTHFRRDLMSLEDAGYRATMAALSDLAAMGSEPLGVLAALVLPRDLADESLLELARGQRDAAATSGTFVVGGNLARGDCISITTTVLGRAERPLTRGDAADGHAVWVSGDLGWSAAGLRALERSSAPSPDVDRAIACFRRPTARIEAGRLAATAGASAAIDVSDGLAADLTHLARESQVTVVLEEDALMDAPLTRLAESLGAAPLDLVLSGGEDYALVTTAPAGVVLPGFRRIGVCRAGPAAVMLRDGSGGTREVGGRGFDHFTEQP
jgi:thiamine-monophosphate kinase